MRRRWKKAALIAAMIVSTTISSERFGHAENSESTEAEYIGEVEQEEISGNQETQEEFAASEDGTEENETEESGLEENESEEAGFEELFSEEEIEEFASEEDLFGEIFSDEEVTDDMVSLYAVPENFVQEGSPVRFGANGFTTVSLGNQSYSSKYAKLGWNADTQVIPWSNAGGDVVAGRRNGSGVNGPYFVPLNDNAKGKYGFRVTNVGYNKEAGTKVDLLLTCVNYRNYTYDYKGNKVTDVYPLFGIGEGSDLWILFKEALPAQEIRIDIVKSGTTTLIPGNYRFRWLDIDMYQRFGILLKDGSIGQRFATNDSVVNVLNKTVFSKSYEVLTAPAEEVKGEVPQNTVVYEVNNCSRFNLCILSTGNEKHSNETSRKIRAAYEEIISGTTSFSAGLNWDSKAYGPIEYPGILKKTGNTLDSQGISNVLPDSTAGYYYTMQVDVPEEYPQYYYNEFRVGDVLPLGCDYNGYVKVKTLPAEEDVSGWFQIGTQADNIIFDAVPGVLGSSAFYGKTYEFQIGVKMDPTEISPAYSGENYYYEMRNQANLTCRHQNLSEGISRSNEVITSYTGTKNRVTDIGVKKYISTFQEGIWKTDATLSAVNDSYRYDFAIDVPWNEYGGYLEQFELSDSLPAGVGLDGRSMEIYGNYPQRVDSWFQISMDGKNVSVKATPEALGNPAFYGKHYEMVLYVKMLSEELLPSYNGNQAFYVSENRYTLTTRQKGDGSARTITSNAAIDRAVLIRPEPEKPEKWILSDGERITQKEYADRDFETVYEIRQKIPEKKKEWQIEQLKIEDTLADCLELKSTILKRNQETLAEFQGDFGSSNGWKMEKEGNKLFLFSEGILPENFYGQEVSLQLTVKLKKNCNLQNYYVENQNAELLEAHIENTAVSIFKWNNGAPLLSEKRSEKTELIVKEWTPKGRITLKKTDKTGNPLSGAKFQIVAAEDIYSSIGKILIKKGSVAAEVETDKAGIGKAEGLYMGKYTVKEILPPAGYVLDSETKEVLAENTENPTPLLFEDEETFVRIKKVSKTETEGEKVIALPGVEFLIWSASEAEDKGVTCQTDKNGQIELKGLVPGTYFFKETSTPEGYILDTKVNRFTVEMDGMVQKEQGHKILVENSYIKAEFLKTDKVTGQAVAGAILQLCDKNGKIIDTWESEKTSHRINRLPEGTYILSELKAPAGYKKGASTICQVRSIGGVQRFQLSDIKLVEIHLKKVIHGEEIVWAHGNPTFTFQIEGTDLEKESYTFFETVEFTPDQTGNQGDVSLETTIWVPAGKYRVRERKTLRYQLEKIDQVVNGKQDGQEVEFSLTENQNGSAVFTNKKVNDSLLTDTAFVRNTVIVKEK